MKFLLNVGVPLLPPEPLSTCVKVSLEFVPLGSFTPSDNVIVNALLKVVPVVLTCRGLKFAASHAVLTAAASAVSVVIP